MRKWNIKWGNYLILGIYVNHSFWLLSILICINTAETVTVPSVEVYSSYRFVDILNTSVFAGLFSLWSHTILSLVFSGILHLQVFNKDTMAKNTGGLNFHQFHHISMSNHHLTSYVDHYRHDAQRSHKQPRVC